VTPYISILFISNTLTVPILHTYRIYSGLVYLVLSLRILRNITEKVILMVVIWTKVDNVIRVKEEMRLND
jgi:hypothetical protein